jgi:glutathione S-transferase
LLTEFNAILLYLAEKNGKLLPKESTLRAKLVEAMFSPSSRLFLAAAVAAKNVHIETTRSDFPYERRPPGLPD